MWDKCELFKIKKPNKKPIEQKQNKKQLNTKKQNQP